MIHESTVDRLVCATCYFLYTEYTKMIMLHQYNGTGPVIQWSLVVLSISGDLRLIWICPIINKAVATEPRRQFSYFVAMQPSTDGFNILGLCQLFWQFCNFPATEPSRRFRNYGTINAISLLKFRQSDAWPRQSKTTGYLSTWPGWRNGTTGKTTPSRVLI